jgi:hypothetical protein
VPLFAFLSRIRWEADLLEFLLVAWRLGSGPTTLLKLRVRSLVTVSSRMMVIMEEGPFGTFFSASHFGKLFRRLVVLIVTFPFWVSCAGPEAWSFTHRGMCPLLDPLQVLGSPMGGGLP